jgi:DNA-binding transcriptional ArsR family regulator
MPNFQKLALPGIGHLAQTFATGPVWRGSTSRDVKFTPIPKKKAVRLYHQATAWDRATRDKGRHGGRLGKPACAVLQALIFSFLCHRTGRLDPSYEGLAKKTGYSRSTVAVALRRLRDAGVISWVRRCVGEMRDGRFVLAQERNAYVILAETMWKGYRAAPAVPTAPEPGTWGDHPPVPTALAQAALDHHGGLCRDTILTTLESDPGDDLARALARMGRAIRDRNQQTN